MNELTTVASNFVTYLLKYLLVLTTRQFILCPANNNCTSLVRINNPVATPSQYGRKKTESGTQIFSKASIPFCPSCGEEIPQLFINEKLRDKVIKKGRSLRFFWSKIVYI